MKNLKLLCFFILLAITTVQAQVPDSIPAFKKFLTYDKGQRFTRDSLNMENKQVFVLFDPGCGPCQAFGSALGDKLKELDPKVDYYFISMESTQLIDGYINMFAPKLKGHPQVHFLRDPEGEFILLFSPKNFPSTYVYDRKNGKLLLHDESADKLIKMLPYLKKGKSV